MATTHKVPKIGARVKFTRRNGEVAVGRVDGSDTIYNGSWVSVNTAEKGQNRQITKVRPSQISLA